MSPRLDYQPFAQVSPTGGTGAREQIATSPNMFGAAGAEALGALGKGIGSVAEAGMDVQMLQAQLDAQTHAAELHSWQSNQVTDLQSKYLSLRGKAALDALPDFKKQIDDLHQQARDQAGNQYTARVIDQEGRRLNDDSYRVASRHAASERKTWEQRTAENAALSYGSRAALSATQSAAPVLNDDVTVQTALRNSDNEVRNLFGGQGYDHDAIEAEVQKNRGRNVKQIVEQIASDASPDGASPGSIKRAYDFYKAQEDRLDATSRLAIQNYLKAPLNQIAGTQFADQAMGRVGVGDTPLSIARRFVGADEVAQRDLLSKAIGPIAGKSVDPATTAWCAAFVNGVLHQAGMQGTDSLAARSFLNVGHAVDGRPQEGDIVVLSRGDPNGPYGHVGFYVGEGATPGSVRILAGNQGNKVAYADYPASQVLGVRRVSKDDIGATPMIDSVAGRPLVSRGDAMLRVINDPALQDRPQVQAAALSRINKIYQAYDLQGAQDKASFELRIKNSTAEALTNGTVAQPLTHDQFVANLGGADGEKAWAEYQQNVQLGADIRATAGMTPAEQDALYQKYAPQPGETFIAQKRRQDGLKEAIDQNREMLRKTPGDYLIQRTDIGRDAFKQFQMLVSDPNATPELRTNYAEMYAEKMRAEQLRLGVPPEKVQIVPSGYIQQLNAQIAAPAQNGGSLATVQRLNAEAALWGKNWPDVYRLLAKDSQPFVRVVGSGIKTEAAQMLADLEPLSLGDILKDQDTERAATIKKDVLTAFKPLAGSMLGNEGAVSVFNDFRGQAEKLAAAYVMRGMTSGDAATKAFEDMVGFKYTFQDGYRVPKDIGIEPADIGKGAVFARDGLTAADVRMPADTFGGLSEAYRADAKVSALRRDGVWVTSPDEKGLMLVYGAQAVRRADGQPFTLTWKELQARGKQGVDDYRRAVESNPWGTP